MNILALLLWTAFLATIPDTVKAGDCGQAFPIEINGKCYALKTDNKVSFDSAQDTCKQIDGRMTSMDSKELLEEIEKKIYKYVTKNMETAKFWIGLLMEDRSMKSKKEDRVWTWSYDSSEIVQKDYKLWDEEGGTKKAGLTCAAVDCENQYKVKALDCGGSKLPIICQMKGGEACKHDQIPFLTYGDYCFAVVTFADAYFKVAPGCEPNTPTKYMEEMKSSIIMAIKNSFIGGGIFMNMKKQPDGRFIDLITEEEPEASEWEEGEPRDEYKCVGRALQPDNTLKLKTINCGFMASFLCISNKS